MATLVLDTNVLVAALLRGGGSARAVLRACLRKLIVTRNLRDLTRGELKFPNLQVLKPEQCLEVFPCLP